MGYHCFLEPEIVRAIDTVIPDEMLAYLDLTGRQGYYQQGIYGQGITVAIIDTGISEHPELTRADGSSKIIGGVSFCPYTTSWADDNGHGTHVGSLVAGNDTGPLHGAALLAVKVLDGGGSNTVLNVIRGFEWCAAWRGEDGKPMQFVNASLSIPLRLMTAAEVARFQKALDDLEALNIAVFASSGNTGAESEYRLPSMYHTPFTVAAVDHFLKIAYFSTRSPEVDFCQIGTQVIGAHYKGGYAIYDGTSQATPLALAVAGLRACEFQLVMEDRIPEPLLYKECRAAAKDLGDAGVDPAYGAGFLTLDKMQDVKVERDMVSSRNIDDCRPDVAANLRTGLAMLSERGYPGGVSCTYRDQEYQTFLYEAGKAPALVAYHGVTVGGKRAALAFDLFQNIKGKEYAADFFTAASEIFEGLGFTWGGRWPSVDKPHFQWDDHGKYTAAMIRAGNLPPEMPLYKEDDDIVDMQGLIKLVSSATDQELAALQAALGNPTYARIDDVPEYWQAETRALMAAAAIDGGTPAEKDAEDVNISRFELRPAIILYRFVKQLLGEKKEGKG